MVIFVCVSRGEEKNKRVLVCDRLTYSDGWFLTENKSEWCEKRAVKGATWNSFQQNTGKQSACECHGNRRGLKLKCGTCRIRNFNAPQGWQWIANINEANFFLWFHKEFFSFVVFAWWWWAISMWEFWFFWLWVLMRNLHGEKFSFTRQCTFHTVLFAYFRTILFALVGFWWIYSEKLWTIWSPWTQFEVILTRKIKIPAFYIPLKIPKKIRSILLSLALMFLIPTPTTMHFSLCVHFTSFYRTRKRIFANGMRGKNCFIYVGDATGVCAWNK